MAVKKKWPSRTGDLEREGEEGRRSWSTSLGQEGHRIKLVHNDVKTWDSWDHCPIYAVIEENPRITSLRGGERKNGRDGSHKMIMQDLNSGTYSRIKQAKRRKPGDNIKTH